MPPAARKVSRPRIASSSSVSRQSAEKPGATIATFVTPCAGKRGQRRVGRRLEPFGAAEARLEGDRSARARAPRRAAAPSCGNGNDRDRRARASARGMPWKLARIAWGSKSSAGQPLLEPRLQRRDIGGIVMIRRKRPHRRLPAQAAQMAEGLVVRRRRRRRAILRIERRDQDPLAALALQRVDPSRRSPAGRSASHGRRSHCRRTRPPAPPPAAR